MHCEIKSKIENEKKDIFDEEIEKFTNSTIAKITNNLEKFNYNVIVANMYETYNYLINYLKKNKDIKNLAENYNKILICFTPVIPHLANECINDLGLKKILSWPDYDKKLLSEDKIKIIVQINGKKRLILNTFNGIEERELLEIVKKDKIIQKYLNNKDIKNIIFVKNRLINILLNE